MAEPAAKTIGGQVALTRTRLFLARFHPGTALAKRLTA